MARFKRIKVPEPSWDSICNAVRNALAASESVELVAMLDGKGGVKFDVRAWDGIRKDESNEEKAQEGKEF